MYCRSGEKRNYI